MKNRITLLVPLVGIMAIAALAQTAIDTYPNTVGTVTTFDAPIPPPPDEEFGTVTVETLVVSGGASLYVRTDDGSRYVHVQFTPAGQMKATPLTPAQAQAKGLP